MQLGPITTLSHALEDLLSQIRDGHFSPTRNTVDLMLAAIDTLEQLVALVAQGGELPESDDLASRIRNHAASAEETTPPSLTPAAILTKPAAEPAESLFRASDENSTTRIRTSLLDRLVIRQRAADGTPHPEDWSNRNQADELQPPLKELSTLLRQLQERGISGPDAAVRSHCRALSPHGTGSGPPRAAKRSPSRFRVIR